MWVTWVLSFGNETISHISDKKIKVAHTNGQFRYTSNIAHTTQKTHKKIETNKTTQHRIIKRNSIDATVLANCKQSMFLIRHTPRYS